MYNSPILNLCLLGESPFFRGKKNNMPRWDLRSSRQVLLETLGPGLLD